MTEKRVERLEIEALGPKGDGIARLSNGETVFVGRAAAGDVVDARVNKNKQGILRGDIRSIVTPSLDRIEAPCPHYQECGGCQLQHITPAVYQDWTQETVLSALAARDVVPETMLSPVFIPEHTRRRANWVALTQKDKVYLGYNQQRAHSIVDINECLVLHPRLNEIKDGLKPYLKRLLRDSRRANIFVQLCDDLCEVVITGELASRRGEMDLAVMEAVADMAQALGLARVSWREKERHTPQVMIAPQPFKKRFGVLEVDMPPQSFIQPSAEGETALVQGVMQALEKFVQKKKPRMADLFAGSGCFAGHMAAIGAVDAYEFDDEAIDNVSRAAGGKGIQAYKRNLFERPLTVDELNVYGAVVFDPPRAGAKEQAATLAGSKVPLVVGVSCNPRSFARDAETLINGGYVLKTLQIVDQFVYSAHLEVIGTFIRP
ncbi:MAG: TRAM domain-containing protein [Pseudomonadota bacterium]|nr:TRAM domain-containing protein [Pseudomonadota bacterium]MED5423310.1 TRAM domain-containing protein [Pseudomonadota bacterium]